MTAGERLVFLSGPGAVTAGMRLISLAAGANAGARLVARSGLGANTAAVHLLYDPETGPASDNPHAVCMIVNMGTLMLRR